MSKRQREARDARVYADRRRGVSWAAIEERHGVSARQGLRIVDRMADRRPLIEVDPDEAVRELLEHFEQAIEDLAMLVDSTNDAVRVAAITRRVEIVERRVLTLRELGLIPADWRRWRHGLEARELYGRLVGVLSRHPDVPASVVAELAAVIDEEPSAPTLTPVQPKEVAA